MEIDYHFELREEVKVGGKIGGITAPQDVKKTWGWERIHKNSYSYCMKELWINPGHRTSKHFHLEKEETLLVARGSLTIVLFNKGLDVTTFQLVEGESFTMMPGMIHSLINSSPEGCLLIEASTFSRDSDSIRLKD